MSSIASQVVIREVTKDVWTFSCPFSRFGVLPFGGRSTAIKLSNGDVFVLASTPLTEETKTKLNELGPVKYIVGQNAVHHLYLGAFKKEYPQAKVLGVEPLVEKKKDEVKFDGVYGQDAAGTQYGYEDDIKSCYFSGFQNKEVAFFHAPSKSLMVADLLFNLPAREQYSKAPSNGTILLFSSALQPSSWFHKQFAWRLGTEREEMKKDVATVVGWGVERIIPCHGDVIETGGDKAWKDAYGAYLQ